MATHYSTKGFFHNTPKARDGAVRIYSTKRQSWQDGNPAQKATWVETWVRKQKRPERFRGVFVLYLAEWTGLEPATPGVTGRYSNQLNYHSALTC